MKAHAVQKSIELVHEADFSLGDVRVRPSSREVVGKSGTEVLEPRVMQVLVTLARQRGHVVSREDLVAACWSGRVVGDDAISRCIVKLRRLAETHRTFAVETIARTGYRLLEIQSAHENGGPPADAPRLERDVPNAVASPTRQKWMPGGVAVLVLAAAVAVYFGFVSQNAVHSSRERQELVFSEMIELVHKDQYTKAFTLARGLRDDDHFRNRPDFVAAWKQIIVPMRPLVAEEGATVYFKSYEDVDGEWIRIGTSPIAEMVNAPLGTLRVKVEKAGFRTGYFAVANPGPSVETNHPTQQIVARNRSGIPLPLVRDDALAADMVAVPSTNIPVWLAGWTVNREGEFRAAIPSFQIARFEVTNQEFKEFVDAGGYENREFWQGMRFVVEGRPSSFEEARTRFVDSTDRPGPAEWQLSTYPSGKGDYPVSGISWYEAVAYARFRGKALPTIHHWVRAAFAPFDPRFNTSPAIALMSGFLTDGPTPARTERGLGPWGTYHMAGNVREWVWNSTGAESIALGGTWTDYASAVRDVFTTSPMDRVPTIGLRLMDAGNAGHSEDLRAPIVLPRDHPAQERIPVSDDAFAAMRFQFSTARIEPLAATVEPIRETPLWVAEEVKLRLPGDRLAALYVFRPKNHSGSLQPIIYSPPNDCCAMKRSNREMFEQLKNSEFVVNSGRALVIPIWAGSYERFLPIELDPQAQKDRERRYALAWQQDLSVTLDYLGSRDDIDMDRVGYLGVSRGAAVTALVLAIEPRVKAAVLVSGGIILGSEIHPMVDLVHYAPRISIPVLMINGRFDHLYSYERSQRRLFDLLATPAEQKAHSLYDAGHYQYPLNSLARDATNWFDRYLGEVQ